MKRILVKLSFLVEQDSRARLTLELREDEPILAWDTLDFELDLHALDDGLEFLLGLLAILFLGRLVDLLCVVEVDFPVGVRHSERLPLGCHLLSEF